MNARSAGAPATAAETSTISLTTIRPRVARCTCCPEEYDIEWYEDDEAKVKAGIEEHGVAVGEARVCVISEPGCKAPAGYGIGGGSGGYAEGDKSTRGTCWNCEEPVCTACSRRMMWRGTRLRICSSCEQSEVLDRLLGIEHKAVNDA